MGEKRVLSEAQLAHNRAAAKLPRKRRPTKAQKLATTLDPVVNFYDFRRDFCPVEGDFGPSPLLLGFHRTWYDLAFPDGTPVARNIMDCRTKKEGKSADAAAVALYMATRAPYSEVVIAAADKDQAKDRVYRACRYAIDKGPLKDHCKVYKTVIDLDNKSLITALPMDWAGAAGGNYSCVVFDELHAYTFEGQRRLFDELIIPPTQPNGVRWIATYAGWLGESVLLWEWWQKALEGKQISEEYPIYLNSDASLLALIDVGEASWRMPWITPEYLKQVENSERPNTYRRLWYNDWVTNESQFVTREQWEACKGDVKQGRMVLGADASTTRDSTSLVGSRQVGEFVHVTYARIWKPEATSWRGGRPTVDLVEGLDAEVRQLHKQGLVDAIVYDPYQLHSLALEWEKDGIRCIELPQTNARIEADQALWDAVIQKSIVHFDHPGLTEHVLNAVARETPRGFRLDKEKTNRKIDGAVALSMSHWGARAVGDMRHTLL